LIQRYVIPEQKTIAGTGIRATGRGVGGFAVTEEDTLHMPATGIGAPLAEFHESLTLPPLRETFW
jgi:hypothetical protein